MRPESVIYIFQQMRHKMMALGHVMLRDTEDVNDAMQDAFCRIWNYRDNIVDGEDANGLVLTTMRNVCIDNIRSRAYAANVPIEAVADDEIETEPRAADADEMYADVIGIMKQSLTETQGRIMHMRDVEGMAYSDIAKIMHMEEAAVRMSLSRARKTVRNIYRKRNE